MLSVYALVPLFIMIGATFYFTNKLTDSSWTVKLLYFGLEVVSVIGFSYLFFLHGFIPSAFVVIIISVIIFIVLVTLYLLTLHFYDNVYEQFSVIFNSLLFFIKVILSFYLFMTIFRYQTLALQISISVLLTGGLFAVSYYLEKPIVRIVNKTYRYLDNFDRYEFVLIPLLIVLSAVFFFEAPNRQTAETLHLHNSVHYLAVNDGLQTDINVNFDQEKIMEFVIDNRFSVRDYYYTEDYVYLYLREQFVESYSGVFYILDRATGEILHDDITPRETFLDITAQSFWTYSGNDVIFEYDGELFLFATNGVHLIEDDTVTKIAPFSLYESMYFFEDGELYIILRTNAFNYTLYHYDNQAFTEAKTINFWHF